MRVDPTGHAWWHWAIAGGIVVGLAAATIITCGGVGAAASAIYLVANGVAAGSTAATVTASAFIGSASFYGAAVLSAASTSSTLQEFADQGNWLTVAVTAGGAVIGGVSAYVSTRTPTIVLSVKQKLRT